MHGRHHPIALTNTMHGRGREDKHFVDAENKTDQTDEEEKGRSTGTHNNTRLQQGGAMNDL
jgi:hypothetical protein